MARLANICAGPYGPIYDFCIEREWLMRPLARLVWGIEMAPVHSTMDAIGDASPGATILDVPCGGGIAFRALRPNQDVRYIAGDLLEPMLERAERRAEQHGLASIRHEGGEGGLIGGAIAGIPRMRSREFPTRCCS